MTSVLNRKQFQQQVFEQVSPRHVTVEPALASELDRWLAKQDLYLHTNIDRPATAEVDEALATRWLGLRYGIGRPDTVALSGTWCSVGHRVKSLGR